MKVAQRFIAIVLIFMIWILAFRYVHSIHRQSTVSAIPCPEKTIGIVKINSRDIFSKILFDYSFRNKDAKMMKTVSEYYQNWAQDTSGARYPIDFSENFCFIKLKLNQEIIWVLAGKSISNRTSFNGFIRKGFYYEIVSKDKKKAATLQQQLMNGSWFLSAFNPNKALTYELINNKQLKNEYVFSLRTQELAFSFKARRTTTMIVPDSTRSFFHISTRLNRGSFLPEKYADLDVLTDKLAGFSFNYYGARYINDAERGTYIDPEFDLLFNFSKKTKPTELTKILRKVAKEDVRVESDWIYLNRARYRLKAINDSTIFIGKNNPKLSQTKAAYSMRGKPHVLTEIKDLGWTGGLLELIPEYRALKDFSQSVESIQMHMACDKNTCTHQVSKQNTCQKNMQHIRIKFKPGSNARLETFRVLLTMANAYQFQQINPQ
jgi:hypothetical protein